ncbi:MAG: hypothetical protein QNJ41_24665 [Xenococcaceae cyanobacterium MO_188.B32]|nr:hypothetical protein [Xenococcaceae cyanobacterium MO_188.B32]
MNLNLLKQRIVSSVLMTIALIVINPSNGEGLEVDIDNGCNQFSVNSHCKNI